MTTSCYCIGPQNGETGCPCVLREKCIKPTVFENKHDMGWECPKCGGVYAPFVPSCMFCAPKLTSSS
jgi:hypothetical protein